MVFCPKTFKTEGNTQASQNILLHFQRPNGLQLYENGLHAYYLELLQILFILLK